MSEQNQMAISPVTAGIVGAGAGAIAGGTIKALQPKVSGYGDAKALLTMEKDSFEKISKPADDAADDLKTSYKTIEEGRKIISEAGDQFETDTIKPAKNEYESKLTTKYGSDAEFAEGTFKHNDKTITELKTAYTNAQNAVTNVADDADVKSAQTALDEAKGKVDVKTETEALDTAKEAAKNAGVDDAKIAEDLGVKAAQKALDDKIAADADVQTKTTALENAKKAAVEKNETVASAKKALEDAKADRLTKMEDKLRTAAAAETDKKGPLNTLLGEINTAKTNMAKKFDASTKADDLLKDTKYGTAYDKLKGIMPRSKWKGAAIGAAILGAVGVALAYIVGPKNTTPTDVA